MQLNKAKIFISQVLITVLLSGIFPYAAFHHHDDHVPLCALESTKHSAKSKPKEHIHETHPSCNLCDEVILKNANLVPGFSIDFKATLIADFQTRLEQTLLTAEFSKLSRGPPAVRIG